MSQTNSWMVAADIAFRAADKFVQFLSRAAILVVLRYALGKTHSRELMALLSEADLLFMAALMTASCLACVFVLRNHLCRQYP